MSLVFLNLGLRFLLEIASLVAVGMWGYQQADGTLLRWTYAIGIPLMFSVIWGVFNVPGDPSRSGHAPVPVPGAVRLIIEILFFAGGAFAFFALRYNTLAGTFVFVVLLHYLVAFNRITWLLGK